jgi:hypothetical protein
MASINGTSFKKAFFNSIFWEGVGVVNSELIINFTNYEKRGLYSDANPTLRRGESGKYQRPDFNDPANPYYFSKTPLTNNLGIDLYSTESMPHFLSMKNGSGFMDMVNLLPGMNYHANVHDPFVSMFYKASSFFKNNTVANLFVNIPTQIIAISNYAVAFNHNGLLNNYQNGIK